jgi:hypothetical protein
VAEVDLPLVDEHHTIIGAGPDAVWTALRAWWDRMSDRKGVRAYARLVGCEDAAGFHVAREIPPSELALAGRHRFSTYELTFRVSALESERSRLSAETRAQFPGVTGGAYRTLVIGTRFHVFAVRRLLVGIERGVRP